MSFKSELNYKLLAEDRDCTFNATYYNHLIILGIKIQDTTLDGASVNTPKTKQEQKK